MANKIIGGVAYLKVDGTQYSLRGNLKVSPSSRERTGVAGQDGVHGYTEVPRIPFIEGDISDSGGLSVLDLEKLTDVTVTAELASGKTYVLRNAWVSGAREVNAAEGSMTLRFEGLSCEEITV